MRRLVIGDIHGRFEALKEVLDKASFDYEKDMLIVLGDVADGGYNTAQVVEELLKIKNLIYIVGNHDEWFMNHIKTGWAEEVWLQQGGCNTLNSYGGDCESAESIYDKSKVNTTNIKIPKSHKEFFDKGKYYFELDGMLFVHGGINPAIPKLSSQSKHDLLWDRNLIEFARKKPVPGFKKVFVGHTTTESYGSLEPLKFNNLIMMDCGAGWTGKLAIMDINTEQFWLSEKLAPTGR